MKPLQSLARRAGEWWKTIRGASLRSHLSTLVLLLPVLAVLVPVNWPGWRAAYLDPLDASLTNTAWPDGYRLPGIGARYEYGWPIVFMRRKAAEISPLMFEEKFGPQDRPREIIDFRFAALAGDVIAAMVIATLVGSLIEARRRRRQSCLQFHLSELLIFVTVVALGFSFYATRRKQFDTERRVYESALDKESGGGWGLLAVIGKDIQHEGPDWLVRYIGEDRYCDLFGRVCAIFAEDPKDIKEVIRLRRILLVRLAACHKEEAALLTQMPSLEGIWLMCKEDDPSTELPPLPRLRALSLYVETTTTDAMPRPRWKIGGLSGLKSLEAFVVQYPRFDDSGLVQLKGLNHLGYLGLSETRVTDAGLESLKCLKALREVHLNGTRVTADGVRRLQEALPNCTIQWSPREPDAEKTEK